MQERIVALEHSQTIDTFTDSLIEEDSAEPLYDRSKNEHLTPMSIHSYPLFDTAFQSPSFAALRAKNIEEMAIESHRSSDLSWTKSGQASIALRESKLNTYASTIQHFFCKKSQISDITTQLNPNHRV
ncbi:MAG: hypothetical protein KBD83_03370 [Gammaproteobacteria bacterium]|nr:hypothetical protein [Gammaproteobacteria bacterium]